MLHLLDIPAGSELVEGTATVAVILAVILAGPILVEAIVLWVLRWSKFARALVASLLANVATIVLGVVLAVVGLAIDSFGMLFFAFVLSILVEAGVLILLKPNAIGEAWRFSAIINTVSYVLIFVPFFTILGF